MRQRREERYALGTSLGDFTAKRTEYL